MNEIEQAIHALEAARVAKQNEIAAIDDALQQLQKTVLVVASGQMPQSSEYAGLGIVDAAKRWLTEVGEARSTREIADALQSRGLVTRSKNFVATVYATLTNSNEIKRTKTGTWEVVRKEGGR